jgi:hypothetical protein
LTPEYASSTVMLMCTLRPLSTLRGAVAAGLLIASGLTGGCRDISGPVSTAWEGDLLPTGPLQLQGSVAVVSRLGRSETSIQISSAEPGATYSWRIRSGSCQDGGAVVGGTAVYPEIVPDPSGTAEGGTVLSRELDPGGTYAAWLFRVVAGPMEELIACGEIRRLS